MHITDDNRRVHCTLGILHPTAIAGVIHCLLSEVVSRTYVSWEHYTPGRATTTVTTSRLYVENIRHGLSPEARLRPSVMNHPTLPMDRGASAESF